MNTLKSKGKSKKGFTFGVKYGIITHKVVFDGQTTCHGSFKVTKVSKKDGTGYEMSRMRIYGK